MKAHGQVGLEVFKGWNFEKKSMDFVVLKLLLVKLNEPEGNLTSYARTRFILIYMHLLFATGL